MAKVQKVTWNEARPGKSPSFGHIGLYFPEEKVFVARLSHGLRAWHVDPGVKIEFVTRVDITIEDGFARACIAFADLNREFVKNEGYFVGLFPKVIVSSQK